MYVSTEQWPTLLYLAFDKDQPWLGVSKIPRPRYPPPYTLKTLLEEWNPKVMQ